MCFDTAESLTALLISAVVVAAPAERISKVVSKQYYNTMGTLLQRSKDLRKVDGKL